MTSHLLHVFATFAPGGPQVRTVQLIDALGGAFRHTICAMDGCLDARELLDGGCEVDFIEPPPPGGTLGAVLGLRGLLRAAAPDLLLSYNWGSIEAVIAGRLLGLANIHHEDGFLPDEIHGFKRRRVWTRRVALRWPRRVIVPSHRLQALATDLWRLAEERVQLVPNGLRTERYQERDGNPDLRAQLGISHDDFVVGCVGHLRAEKNPVRLVEAVAAMQTPGARLLMLGDGPERPRVEEALRAHGLEGRAHLTGHVDDPREYYRAMDAFAIPSDTEQMPVALLEAMACGLPVAATDVGDVARMVPPQGRELVVERDARALAAALDRLAGDDAARDALGRAGRAHVLETYQFEAMLDAYRSCYDLALAP